MNFGAFLGVLIAIIGILLAGFFYFNGQLDKRIDQAINNPVFIQKVAKEIRLPFLIFDNEDNWYNAEVGSSEYIEKTETILNEKGSDVVKVIIYCKKFLKVAPMLEAINDNIDFKEPVRSGQKNWEFERRFSSPILFAVQPEEGQKLDKKVWKFKLTIIK
jgi:hypothetical protein